MREPSLREMPAEGEAGFTLMELLVVVSIVGILAVAFGASFIGWREQYNAESDIKKIHAAFMDAKMGALKDRRYYFVNIPTVPADADHILRIFRDIDPTSADPDKSPGDAKHTAADPQVGPDIELKNRISMDGKYRQLWYNAQGHLNHRNSVRDFNIILLKLDEDKVTESDINCLAVSPPLYVAGGISNGLDCVLK